MTGEYHCPACRWARVDCAGRLWCGMDERQDETKWDCKRYQPLPNNPQERDEIEKAVNS